MKFQSISCDPHLSMTPPDATKHESVLQGHNPGLSPETVSPYTLHHEVLRKNGLKEFNIAKMIARAGEMIP